MDGIIIINKSKKYTSHDIVYKIKKLFNQKVGHTGTLDPLATGVLPILIGKGTQCSKYLTNHNKKYEAQIQLGQKTDTADAEGKIIEEKPVLLEAFSEENVNLILEKFLGEQEQVPPIYSAIKVNGKKLYEYARKGEKIEIQPRKIKIYDIKLLHIDKSKNTVDFEVSCSKGTYIRSLCEDIAEKLGTVGYMSALRRTRVGEFSIKNAITLDELEKNKENIEFLKSHILTIEEIFDKEESICLNDKKLTLFLNGVQLRFKLKEGIYKIYDVNKNFIGIGIIKNNLLKRDIVI